MKQTDKNSSDNFLLEYNSYVIKCFSVGYFVIGFNVLIHYISDKQSKLIDSIHFDNIAR